MGIQFHRNDSCFLPKNISYTITMFNVRVSVKLLKYLCYHKTPSKLKCKLCFIRAYIIHFINVQGQSFNIPTTRKSRSNQFVLEMIFSTTGQFSSVSIYEHTSIFSIALPAEIIQHNFLHVVKYQ